MASEKDVALSPDPPGSPVEDESTTVDFGELAPTEVLILPKVKFAGISMAEEEHCEMLGQFLYTAKLVAKREGLLDHGFRVVIKDGPDGGQAENHLYMILVGGKKLKWPPG